nr:DNA helicase [Tanacetum cinerariifolium]
MRMQRKGSRLSIRGGKWVSSAGSLWCISNSSILEHASCGLMYRESRSHVAIDEIKNYLDLRYISPHEACSRMLEFDIHHREPAVQILSIHLQNMQHVVFRDKDRLDTVVENAHSKKTTQTEWMHYNEWNTDGRHLTYLDFPSGFVWNANGKYWSRRRQRHKASIGRLTYVHPAAGDLFNQRMLLCHQKGCKSFPKIRTVNDVVHPTCRAACQALGLLEDDQEWETTMTEAACTASPAELRTLFAHILTFCQVSDPSSLETYDSQLEDYVLCELEGCLNHCSRSLTDFGLCLPPEDLMSVLRNRLLMEDKSYDRNRLDAYISYDEALPHGQDGGEVELLGAIDWKSSKQSTTTMPAIEAEYIVASEVSIEAVWIRKFIFRLGIIPTNIEPIKMYCKNSVAILIANEP